MVILLLLPIAKMVMTMMATRADADDDDGTRHMPMLKMVGMMNDAVVMFLVPRRRWYYVKSLKSA